jgi:hypothetical protein
MKLLASAKSQSENVIYKYWECFSLTLKHPHLHLGESLFFPPVLGFHLTYFIVFALTFVASPKLKFKQWAYTI